MGIRKLMSKLSGEIEYSDGNECCHPACVIFFVFFSFVCLFEGDECMV